MVDWIVSNEYSPSSVLHREVLYRLRTPSRNVFIVVTVALVLLAGIASAAGYLKRDDYEVAKAWLPLLFILALGWVFHALIQKSAIKKAVVDSDVSTKRYKFRIGKRIFEEEGSDGTKTALSGKEITKNRLYDDCLVLWEGRDKIHILPLSAFKSRSEMTRAHALIDEQK